ncbi:glycosyltransferase [Raoultibacter massiliensis]|uniref:Glycosyltransferase n=1 Tax=Raoultibacter massiliensis TaxID=1852371 RepID=A0ABV1JCE0_9ACTN|nr:glycosyltransferase [Raoultibacter massiliensis]
MADPHAPRISVIVPICNVAAFLDQCLESIEYQTARDMEIICLNDGSTDDSLAIMKRHAAADARIRVVDKENEGYGATCNRGIELASGDYVAIVEPDDYLLPTMFEDLLAFADSFEHPADVVKEAWFDVVGWDDPLSERVVPGYLYKRLKTTREPQSIEGVPELLEGHPSIWSALYRKSFLDENGIRFHEYPGAGWADNPFLVDTLCRAKRIIYLDSMHYCYRNELPRKGDAPLDEKKLSLPLLRWMEMTESLRACGIENRDVWHAHYQRGFNYIDIVVEQGGWEVPTVRVGIRELLGAMRADLVLDHPKLSPSKKRFYLEQTGGDGNARISPVPYARHLAHELIVRLRAQGPIGALGALGRFSRRTVSPESAEKVK